jgi:hypothetical protein
MNIHSVFPVDENRVATKISSCFYDGCFVAGKFRQSCPGWEEPIVRFQDEIETPSVDNQESREDDVRTSAILLTKAPMPSHGPFPCPASKNCHFAAIPSKLM